MKIGYIRISTVGQNTARQEVLMRELGVDQVFIRDHPKVCVNLYDGVE